MPLCWIEIGDGLILGCFPGAKGFFLGKDIAGAFSPGRQGVLPKVSYVLRFTTRMMIATHDLRAYEKRANCGLRAYEQPTASYT
jgi:hypothetical protein